MPIDNCHNMPPLIAPNGTSNLPTASIHNFRNSYLTKNIDENFECLGQNGDLELETGSLPPPIILDSNTATNIQDGSTPPKSLPPSNFIGRNSWARRSLRALPASASKRSVGNSTLSSLYRSPSFSSGRSSAHDENDIYSDDASLEDDVSDLNHKVQILQQQVGVLAENQNNTDDRYSRIKQDNSALLAKVMMLEEQLRDSEIRAEERLKEEQKRNRELIARVEKEKQLTVENFSIKSTNIEKELNHALEENSRLKSQYEFVSTEKKDLQSRLHDLEDSVHSIKEEKNYLHSINSKLKDEYRIDSESKDQLIQEFQGEVSLLRTSVELLQNQINAAAENEMGTEIELQNQIKILKQQNKELEEQKQELEAQLLTCRLEEGRSLISSDKKSLAAEFELMTNEEEAQENEAIIELQKNLQESQESNKDLKNYIDGILLNIVDNYPQLLEVKSRTDDY